MIRNSVTHSILLLVDGRDDGSIHKLLRGAQKQVKKLSFKRCASNYNRRKASCARCLGRLKLPFSHLGNILMTKLGTGHKHL